MWLLKTIAAISTFLCSVQSETKCVKWTPKFVDFDGPSMVYSESVNGTSDGIGTHLSIFAMLWTLRRSYNVDVFISKSCKEVLSKVFTEKSLAEIPVLQEYFCNPEEIQFEYFNGPFDVIAKKKEFRVGRSLWLWPGTEVLKPIMKAKGTVVQGDDYDKPFRGYKSSDHDGSAHARLKQDYLKWMKRKLEFHESIMDSVTETLENIARKMDLKPSEVTYIGIHHRRSPHFAAHYKKYYGSKPLKKGYFYDAMEEMRESYENLAFLYVSDDMKWGRANIKDKENDLYFVGLGQSQQDQEQEEVFANDAFDFALLAHCNHSIITRGAFSTWIGEWTGGEFYTEYGAIVPNEVNDAITEEASKDAKGSLSESFGGSGAKRGDPDGLLFPDLKIEGSESVPAPAEESSWFSW